MTYHLIFKELKHEEHYADHDRHEHKRLDQMSEHQIDNRNTVTTK